MKFLWVLFSFFLLISCTSVRPISLSPNELQKQITVGHIIKTGDEVKIETRDGKIHRFKVLSVTNNYIAGRNIKIPIKEISQVNKVEISMGKTIALIAGVIVLAIGVKETAEGILEPFGNVVSN